MRELYPDIRPYREGRLRVSPIHEIAFRESGNPNGKPVICLHGGPGTGSDAGERRLFDPGAYRIVQFDQRGCGGSSPRGDLTDNTTWELVGDLEKIREHLGIERWLVCGGSWGSTLALAYAETHPERVSELVLRGVFLLRPEELAFFYQHGTRMLFPDAWEDLALRIPEAERGDLVQAYYRRVMSPDPAVALAASRAWARWEATVCTLLPEPAIVTMLTDPKFAKTFALIELHYVANGAWLADRPLLSQIDRIRHIPAAIVQGRYDMICPLKSAWDLHRAWPEADFRIVEGAGHSAYEPAVASALLEATDRFRA